MGVAVMIMSVTMTSMCMLFVHILIYIPYALLHLFFSSDTHPDTTMIAYVHMSVIIAVHLLMF